MPYATFGHGSRTFVILPGLSDGLSTVRGKALFLEKPYAPFFEQFTVYMFSRKDEEKSRVLYERHKQILEEILE